MKNICSASPAHLGVSRRNFLKLSGLTAFSVGGATFLTACGPAAQTSNDAGSATNTSADEEAVLGDGQTLRVGMEAANPPYNWQVEEASDYTIPLDNVDGSYVDGYDVQIAKIIAEGLGMDAVAVKLSFDGLIDALNNGQIDIICAGMSVTPEREKSALFSDSYIDDDIVMITKADSQWASAKTFADLAGAAIMGQVATMYDDAIDQIVEAEPTVTHLTPAETVPMVIENLSSGAADIIMYSKLSVPKLLEAHPEFTEIEMEDKLEGSVMPNNAAIAKGQDAILEKINEIIDGISEDDRQEMWNACTDRQPE